MSAGNRKLGIIVAMAVSAAAVIYLIAHFQNIKQLSGPPRAGTVPGTRGAVMIVAAENFYGNIAKQLGGGKVAVKSLISNPNIDPHEYESSVEDGIAVASANIVIKNGLEYDTWMDKLLSASPNPGRTVITAGGQKIAPDRLPGNPHVWYGINNIKAIAKAISEALKKTDPADAAVFEKNLAAFNASLDPVLSKMNEIRSKYAGTPVGLTETNFLYQTGPMGLRVLTPFKFEKAISEGNDPAAADFAAANDQINNKEIKVLIYNNQTVTPVTTNLLNAARAHGIPIVPVTETMPSGATYQSWMLGELDALEKGLARSAGH